ncbi:hypothetical protein ACQ0P8_08700 [Halodesulfovibrio aestuarii]|uniref:Conjugal transfer protein TraM n=1 Tax=Halodesulfovibrio aestuarii TaxID=126333 RepID=A0A8G2CA15_9BACT|nr:hypothetical protein [Halodesulfovibrio aestuarii]SHJ07031.1 hypothetical protein SAMN05660830_01546 [Halodesulfovibrio aestuarii]
MEDHAKQKTAKLTAEKVRHALIEKHGQPLSEDDPILMVASMFEMFQDEYDSTLKKHQSAIEKFMVSSSKHYADKVQKSTDDLLNRAVQGNIRNNIEAMADFKDSMNDFTKTNRIYAAVSLCSCVISICLFLSWYLFRG